MTSPPPKTGSIFAEKETQGFTVVVVPTFRTFQLAIIAATIIQLWYFFLFFGIFVFVFAVSPVLPSQNPDHGILDKYRAQLGILIWPGAIAVLLVGSTFYGARKHWRINPSASETKTYTFSESGFDVAGATFTLNVAWDQIKKARKLCNIFFLTTAQPATHFIPLDSFDSPALLDEFERLVRRKVAKTRF